MAEQKEKHRVHPAYASRFAEWLDKRGGLAIWESADLSDPTWSCTTPRLQEDGTPYTKPHWKAQSEPARIITEWDDVEVTTGKEVKRFHVALRRGSQGLTIKLTDGSSRRLRSALAKAGEDAWYEFDYEMQEAVIYVPASCVSLREYLQESTAEGAGP